MRNAGLDEAQAGVKIAGRSRKAPICPQLSIPASCIIPTLLCALGGRLDFLYW